MLCGDCGDFPGQIISPSFEVFSSYNAETSDRRINWDDYPMVNMTLRVISVAAWVLLTAVVSRRYVCLDSVSWRRNDALFSNGLPFGLCCSRRNWLCFACLQRRSTSSYSGRNVWFWKPSSGGRRMAAFLDEWQTQQPDNGSPERYDHVIGDASFMLEIKNEHVLGCTRHVHFLFLVQ